MSRLGPQAPYVSTVEELQEIVSAVQTAGAFSFDVETRGNIHRHADVMTLIETEWKQKLATLKSDNANVLARSRQAIEDRWTGELALDTLRNEVYWIGIAIEGRSWAIPMGHPNGEILVNELRGDGSTIPPPGYRNFTKGGKESFAKGKFFIPAVFTPPPDQLTQDQVFTALEPLFMDEHIVKVNQNIKFDAKSVAKYYGGNLPKGLYIDTMNLMHITNENLKAYNLGAIIDEVFDFDPYWRHGKLGAILLTEPFSRATNYVHYDCRWAWLIYKRLWRIISRYPTLESVLHRDTAVIRPVAQMEMNGICVNRREMTKLGKELDFKLNELIRDMSQYAPLGFNPNADTDVGHLLFGKKTEGGLGLKPTKLTDKTKRPSVDADSLEAQKGKHPVVDLLLEHSEVQKMKSTYIEGMVPLLHGVHGQKNIGRVHPQFHLHRTATGRFSSSDPNLQNIPRDGRMRALFVAEPGDHLVVADYGQIEMRIMAMLSQDPALLNIFDNNIDVHTGTAAVILKKRPEDVTPDERQIYGKTPNFLMGYGGGPKRLVAATNGMLTLDEAKAVVEGYNTGYAGLTGWKNRNLAKARKVGYIETLGGRRRRLPDINTDGTTREGWADRSRAERQAINHIVQGTAAEIMKDAIVALDRVLEFPKCKMLVQVHDEMVISIPSDELGVWVPQIETAMGNGTILTDGIVKYGVRLEVEAHYAGSWDKAKG